MIRQQRLNGHRRLFHTRPGRLVSPASVDPLWAAGKPSRCISVGRAGRLRKIVSPQTKPGNYSLTISTRYDPLQAMLSVAASRIVTVIVPSIVAAPGSAVVIATYSMR